MLPFKYAKFIITFVTCLYIQVNSQDTEECVCTHLRRCRFLMTKPDWLEILQSGSIRTCGYRRVCCPRSTSTQSSNDRLMQEVTTTNNPDVWTFANMRACGQPIRDKEASVMQIDDVDDGIEYRGQNASQGEFPWMVAINIFDGTRFVAHCTGFLIDTIHVITAAHCFDVSKDPSRFIAKIGHVMQSEAATYSIRKIVPHEGYMKGKYYNDVAVMTLAEPVKEPNFIPICLPTEAIMRINLTDQAVTVAGWGSKNYRGELTNHLKKIEHMPVISNRQCSRVLRRVLADTFTSDFPKGITKGIICAGGRNKDSCGGDSGGPLMLKRGNVYYVVGIVAFGVACGRPGVPGGYTRVSSQMKWIVDNTGE